MDKILEVLSSLLPEEQIKEVSTAVEDMLAEARREIEAEYNDKLEEAYAELSEELRQAEKIAEQGYQEAYTIIEDLRNRLHTQKVEFEHALEEGYEEAYQMLLAERGKNESIELDLYKEFDSKLGDMKEYFIEKLDQFLHYKGAEIYEQARRDILHDPSMAEHRVVLDRVVETVSNYISDEDYELVTNSRIASKEQEVEELRGQVRMLEARSIRLSAQNNKLNEQVREAANLLQENTKHSVIKEQNERVERARNVQGRGELVTEGTKVIGEFEVEKTKPQKQADTRLVESIDAEDLRQMQVLSGVRQND